MNTVKTVVITVLVLTVVFLSIALYGAFLNSGEESKPALTAYEKEKEKVLLNIYNKIIECEQDSGEECYMIFLPESEARVDGRPA